MLRRTLSLLLVFGLGVGYSPGHAHAVDGPDCDVLSGVENCKVLASFESQKPGTPPNGWRTNRDRNLVRLTKDGVMTARHNVYVRGDSTNQFVRLHTEDYGFRVIRSHKNQLDWNLDKRPYLRWRWRAKALPDGGNEKYDRSNDTGGALYVTFDTDWLGRPKSIKYTYSSTLPVGTTVDYGPLKVLVVASKPEQGTDKWISHERNVVQDYKRLFDEEPDKTPLAFVLWSDSDTLDETGTIDFDDILLLSGASNPPTAASQ